MLDISVFLTPCIDSGFCSSVRLSLTIRRSNNRFELSLQPARRYLPSRSNSTDVISPRQSVILLTHMPPTASHRRICLSLELPISVCVGLYQAEEPSLQYTSARKRYMLRRPRRGRKTGLTRTRSSCLSSHKPQPGYFDCARRMFGSAWQFRYPMLARSYHTRQSRPDPEIVNIAATRCCLMKLVDGDSTTTHLSIRPPSYGIHIPSISFENGLAVVAGCSRPYSHRTISRGTGKVLE
jgi:hypothetical protein